MQFNDANSDALTLRVSPYLEPSLKAAASIGWASVVNMLEVLVGGYSESKGIDPNSPLAPTQQTAKLGHLNRAVA